MIVIFDTSLILFIASLAFFEKGRMVRNIKGPGMAHGPNFGVEVKRGGKRFKVVS